MKNKNKSIFMLIREQKKQAHRYAQMNVDWKLKGKSNLQNYERNSFIRLNL